MFYFFFNLLIIDLSLFLNWMNKYKFKITFTYLNKLIQTITQL